MKLKAIFAGVCSMGILISANADCNFTVENKTSHPVTMQGYFLEGGSAINDNNWMTAKPNQTATQLVAGEKNCDAIYKHSGRLVTRMDIKNGSGYWLGNEGLLFVKNKSFAYTTAANQKAVADDKAMVTLSNGVPVKKQDFTVVICDNAISADDCH